MHDETSAWSEDESTESEDETFAIDKKTPIKHEVIVVERDYLRGDKIGFTEDAYNFTIRANMSQCCTPQEQSYVLKCTFLVFGLQIFICYFFLKDIGLDQY